MLEKLKKIIDEYAQIQLENITMETRFVEDLGFDSFSFISMLGEVEDEFGVEVDENDILQLKTVGQAVSYIKSLQIKEA